jgi:hypothetical protein
MLLSPLRRPDFDFWLCVLQVVRAILELWRFWSR